MANLRVDQKVFHETHSQNLSDVRKDQKESFDLLNKVLEGKENPISFLSDGSSKGIAHRIGEVRANMDKGPEMSPDGCTHAGWGNGGGSCSSGGWGD